MKRKKIKISRGCLMQNIFFKIKNAFDYNLNLTHIFIKQNFRDSKQALPSPSPPPTHMVVLGVGE
jgi:hypothetical protein